MKLRSILLGSFVVAVAGIQAGDARAQTAGPAYVFDAVTQYANPGDGTFSVTGVQHGASASSTVSFILYSTSTDVVNPAALVCERQLLVAINRPGRFSVTVYGDQSNGSALAGCALKQLP